jgi:sugar phosphate isomerase/epimerase
MSPQNRRRFLISLPAFVGTLRGSPQKQTFLAGLVPGRRGGPAATPVEGFWKACDECVTLGVHHIEVNNTNSQIVQAYEDRLSEFRDDMSKRNLRMLGFAMYSHLHQSEKRKEMIQEHVRVARFLKSIGGRYIAELIAPAANLGNGDDESYRNVDMKAVVANANEIGKAVRNETGIGIGYHPEQGDVRTGIWRRMVEETDPRYYHFWPDVGHLAACGVDPMETYKTYRSRMIGTHLRDVAGPTEPPARARMVSFGEGIIKLPALIAFLRQTDFAGCVMGEGAGNQPMRDYMVRTLGLEM